MPNLPIVMYHCVNRRQPGNPLSYLALSPALFDAHLCCLRRSGFRALSFPQLWELASAGRLSRTKGIVLTFDDGYLDNATIAADILRRHGMSGTIFVNPEFAAEAGADSGASDAWGYLDYDRMRDLQSSGVFDIQSHTMSHNWVFVSDRLVDLYTPEKFGRYYWLAWLLEPACKPHWFRQADRLRHSIPAGYPIFEFDRALPGPQFLPSPAFVEQCVDAFAAKGQESFEDLAQAPDKGRFETPDEHSERLGYEIRTSRDVLETELGKSVEFLCFPGGAYGPQELSVARESGYKAFMASSRDQAGNNLEAIGRGPSADSPVKLKRISFTQDYPGFLKNRWSECLSVKLKVGTFMGSPWAVGMLRCVRGLRNVMDLARPGRRRA